MRPEEIERMRNVLQWKLEFYQANDMKDQITVIKDIIWHFEMLLDHSKFMTEMKAVV